MNKSNKKEKELDRSYDFAEAKCFKRSTQNVGFVKKRANRKIRRDAKKQCKMK